MRRDRLISVLLKVSCAKFNIIFFKINYSQVTVNYFTCAEIKCFEPVVGMGSDETATGGAVPG